MTATGNSTVLAETTEKSHEEIVSRVSRGLTSDSARARLAHFSSTQSSELQIGDHALGPARASQRLSICRLNRPVLNRSDVFIRERQRRLLRHGFG